MPWRIWKPELNCERTLAEVLATMPRDPPDKVLHPIDGGEVVKYQNDDTIKMVKSKQEKLDNLDQAIETAMTSGTGESYDKLTKATNKAKE